MNLGSYGQASHAARCAKLARLSPSECFNRETLFCFGRGESRRDDGHFANFPWLEPAALDGCEAFTREGERHVSDVFYARRDMSVSLAVNRGGKFIQNMENDRDVVRRQIPRDVDVFLE